MSLHRDRNEQISNTIQMVFTSFALMSLSRSENIFKRVRIDVVGARILVRQFLADRTQLSVRTMCLRFLTSTTFLLQCSFFVVKHDERNDLLIPLTTRSTYFSSVIFSLWNRSRTKTEQIFRFQHSHDADIELSCPRIGLHHFMGAFQDTPS